MPDILYQIDITQALAALDKVGAKDQQLREASLATQRVQSQAIAEMAKAALQSTQATQQQAQQQRLIAQAYKALTTELRAQEQAEKALNTERDKAGTTTKRQQELQQAYAANQAALRKVRAEIDLLTQAETQLGVAARTAASIPPPTLPTVPMVAAAAGDGGLGASQRAAQASVEATTAALNQQADAERAVAAQAQPIAGAYSEAARAAVELQQKLQSATAEQQAARAVVTEQVAALRQLKTEQRELTEAQKAGGSTEEQLKVTAALKRNEDEQRKLNRLIAESRVAYQQEGQAVQRVRDAIKQQAQDQKLASAAAKDAVAAEQQIAKAAQQAAAATKQAANAAKEQAGATQEAGKQGGGLKAAFAEFGGFVAGAFTIGAVVEFTKSIITTRAEFERLESVLTNTFSGDKGRAKLALATVGQFALDTGQNITDVTNSFLTLVNRGIEPTRRQLEQLSDFAITSNKSVDQLVEGIVDAQQGQFERLTEFGVKAKVSGDKIIFSFRGVKTEVENTNQAIADYLFGLGDLEGVAGSAAAVADTATGAFGKLKGALTEFFDVVGSGTDGPLTRMVSLLAKGTRNITDLFKSTDRKAIEQATEGVEAYNAQLATLIKQTEASAKQSGKPQAQAVDNLLQSQQDRLEEQLGIARKVLSITEAEIKDSILPSYIQRQDREEEAKRVALLEGELGVLNKVRAARSKAAKDQGDELGLLAKYRKELAALQKQREEAPTAVETTKDGGYNDQIKAKQKQIDDLLEKEKKAAKPAKGPDYLKQLLAAEAKLRADADKLELDMLKDQGQARAAEQLRQANAEIARTEANLKKLEKLAGRDGVIDGVQRDELNAMRLGAIDAYYKEMRRIAQEHSDQLFALQADSDRKEIEAIERRYDREVEAARGQADILVALEEQKQRDILAAQQKQEQRRIDNTADVATNLVTQTVGEVYGKGTGISVIEAKRAEKAALLEIDRKHAQDTLNNALKLTGEEGTIARTGAAAQLAIVKNAIRELDQQRRQFDPMGSIYRLVLGENDSEAARQALDQAVSAAASAFTQLLQADQSATQAKIDARTKNIDDLKTQLAQELQYNKEGSASNIAGIREQIAEERAARREAIQDKRKAAKDQIIIDTLLQSSSVATAAAQALTAFPIPIVGPALGIAAAALIVGAFVASKAKAIQAVNKDPGFFKGGYTGDGDKHDESTRLGKKSYTYHNREFVMNNELTKEYRHILFEPLHLGKPELIDWKHPHMQAILPDMELPKKLRQERQAAQEIKHLHQFAPMQEEFKGMKAELAAIRQHVGATAARPDVLAGPDGSVIVYDPATRSVARTQWDG